MYTLHQAISWSGMASVVSTLLVLLSVLVLYVRAKWFNSHYYESRMAMNKAIKAFEFSALLWLSTTGIWIVLNGVNGGS